MKNNNNQIHLRLPDEMNNWLEEYSSQNGIKKTELIKLCISSYIKYENIEKQLRILSKQGYEIQKHLFNIINITNYLAYKDEVTSPTKPMLANEIISKVLSRSQEQYNIELDKKRNK